MERVMDQKQSSGFQTLAHACARACLLRVCPRNLVPSERELECGGKVPGQSAPSGHLMLLSQRIGQFVRVELFSALAHLVAKLERQYQDA